MHTSCYLTHNQQHRGRDRRNRDPIVVGEKVAINIKTSAKLVLERHPEMETGYHLHLYLPDMGGRTNILIGCNPSAPNSATRIWYAVHNHEKEGCPPLVHLNPEDLSNRARLRLFKMAETMLGSRKQSDLGLVPEYTTPYSLLKAEPIRG